MRRIVAAALSGSTVLAGVLGAAPPAAATFHLMKIREVYPGSSASPDAQYVELQMYAAGQNLVRGHSIDFFDAAGVEVATAIFGSDVPNAANQSTILAATPAAESQFGTAADTAIPSGSIDPKGGAICWEGLDCISWGNFTGTTPSPSGTPADPHGIPDGMALRRTIQPGCPTLLEAGDDTDDSATDFADVFPAPRPSSTAATEHACSAQSPPESEPSTPSASDTPTGSEHLMPSADIPTTGNGAHRPQTTIHGRPPRRTRDRTPTFSFTSNRRKAHFLCKLDRRAFRPCKSPFTTPRLHPGPHVFRVKARALDGATDRSPAHWHFRVLGRRRQRRASRWITA